MSKSMKISFPGGKKVHASFDGFTVETDQSVKYGGQASAPEPYDLFLASLATCAGVYVLGFCQKRNLPTEGVSVVESWDRDEKTKKVVKISISVQVPESFPEKYHKALVRSVDQCAVKKTILDPPEFVVEAVAVGGR